MFLRLNLPSDFQINLVYARPGFEVEMGEKKDEKSQGISPLLAYHWVTSSSNGRYPLCFFIFLTRQPLLSSSVTYQAWCPVSDNKIFFPLCPSSARNGSSFLQLLHHPVLASQQFHHSLLMY